MNFFNISKVDKIVSTSAKFVKAGENLQGILIPNLEVIACCRSITISFSACQT